MTSRFFQLLSLISLTSPAMAEYNEGYYAIDDAVYFDEKEVALGDPLNPSNQEEDQQPPRAEFASARPNLSDGAGLILWGEFLYWQAEEGGLSYGLQSKNYSPDLLLPQSNPLQGVNGKISRIQPEYDAGYRLAATYQLPYDQWDLTLFWARYQTSSSDHISQKSNEVVFPFWLSMNYIPIAQNAKARWTLNFNTLDLDLGRMFYLGKRFSVKPSLGFKAAWIEQTLNVLYGNVVFSTGEASPNIRSKNRCTFQGYGLDLACDGNWLLGAGFQLFYSADVALLWGNFDLALFEKNIDLGPRSKLTNNIQEVVSELGFSAGLSWERSFLSDRLFFNIHVAWEEQIWFNQNQMTRFPSPWMEGAVINHLGDLTFSGWTIGAAIGF